MSGYGTKRKFSSKGSSYKGSRYKRTRWVSKRRFYRKRVYKYRAAKGKYAGRYYRRIRRGGKVYRKYKPASQKITGTKVKAHYPLGRALDRDHVKLSCTWSGRMNWLTGKIATWAFPLLWPVDQNDGGFPSDSVWNVTSAYTSTGSYNKYQGLISMCERFERFYVSSVSFWIKVERDDAVDLSHTELAVVPLNPTQWNGMTATSGPYKFFPGANADEQWANMKMVPGVQVKTLSAASGGGPSTQFIRVHVPIKKYAIPGYPDASETFWFRMNANGTSLTTPSFSFNPWIWIGLFNRGGFSLEGIDFNIEMKATFYTTWMQPRLNSALLVDKVSTGTRSESKEEAKTSDSDGDEELVKVTTGLARMVPSTPPPRVAIPQGPSSSSSSSSSQAVQHYRRGESVAGSVALRTGVQR
nr:Cap [Kummerowia striata CRESS virus]